ncbi:MAG TPA: LON peptidase substrate-binding domain-containing protein [Steroidobacteraceae bacterium]
MTGPLPLFPLHTVLFPGGLLPLRVFEPRYLDMVGRCLRSGDGFGVVLIEDGSDTEREARTAAVGTSARIVDFQTLDDGLLGLLCRGERRFRIGARHCQADGLNCAEVEWLEERRGVPVPPQFQPLLPILREAMAKLTTMGRFLEPDYADAAWIGQRLAELLPLERAVQQQLLEIDDPETRLALLAPLLEAAPG